MDHRTSSLIDIHGQLSLYHYILWFRFISSSPTMFDLFQSLKQATIKVYIQNKKRKRWITWDYRYLPQHHRVSGGEVLDLLSLKYSLPFDVNGDYNNLKITHLFRLGCYEEWTQQLLCTPLWIGGGFFKNYYPTWSLYILSLVYLEYLTVFFFVTCSKVLPSLIASIFFLFQAGCETMKTFFDLRWSGDLKKYIYTKNVENRFL